MKDPGKHHLFSIIHSPVLHLTMLSASGAGRSQNTLGIGSQDTFTRVFGGQFSQKDGGLMRYLLILA